MYYVALGWKTESGKTNPRLKNKVMYSTDSFSSYILINSKIIINNNNNIMKPIRLVLFAHITSS